MKSRRALTTDYEELCRWWKGHGWTPMPVHLLPTGWIIEKDGKPLCAGFVYKAEGVPVAYFEYIVSNPDLKPIESYRAIDFLFEKVTEYLEFNMIQACFAKLNTKGLIKMYKRHNFIEGDTNMKDMVRIC